MKLPGPLEQATREDLMLANGWLALAWAQAQEEILRLQQPISLVIHCPLCNLQHVDVDDETGKWATERHHRKHLNPSTADAEQDDPTIRRCVDFALRNDHYRIEVVNLFALRATNPRELRRAPDPIGPDNDERIQDAATAASIVVCAWGAHGKYLSRGIAVRRLLHALIPWDRLMCFGVTSNGQPKHPLYLKADTPLVHWGAV